MGEERNKYYLRTDYQGSPGAVQVDKGICDGREQVLRRKGFMFVINQTWIISLDPWRMVTTPTM